MVTDTKIKLTLNESLISTTLNYRYDHSTLASTFGSSDRDPFDSLRRHVGPLDPWSTESICGPHSHRGIRQPQLYGLICSVRAGEGRGPVEYFEQDNI